MGPLSAAGNGQLLYASAYQCGIVYYCVHCDVREVDPRLHRRRRGSRRRLFPRLSARGHYPTEAATPPTRELH